MLSSYLLQAIETGFDMRFGNIKRNKCVT